jgi:hypothetical protein
MQPLRREVEVPRHAAGLWAPVLALISATMATLIVGVAVTARPVVRPERPPPPRTGLKLVLPAGTAPAPSPAAGEVHPICGQKVYRATPDGAELYEECAQQRGRGVASGGSDDGKIIRK